jgi:hypothetical protein
MFKITTFLLFTLQTSFVFANCLSNEQIKQLEKSEIDYLSQKIPPAFKHGLASNTIKVAIEKVGNDCKARLVVELPQSDVEEANAILDAQPAKKIMLGAQGYVLPQETNHEAIFNLNADKTTIPDADILQTSPLGKLRASLELMYAFLTQKRAEITPTQTNSIAWANQIRQQEINDCKANQPTADCGCIADQYALKIPANQMEYIQYIRTNPYALAMGSNHAYEEIKIEAKNSCAG